VEIESEVDKGRHDGANQEGEIVNVFFFLPFETALRCTFFIERFSTTSCE